MWLRHMTGVIIPWRYILPFLVAFQGVTESHVQTRPTGFQHVQTRPTASKHVQPRPNTSKHVQRCIQTRPIMYEAIVFDFEI